MQLGFKTKLMAILGVFSIIMTLGISLVNQHRFKAQLIESYRREASLAENVIVTALSDADMALRMTDEELEGRMREFSGKLLEKYRENPDVAAWDYQALKRQAGGMDIYIIDDKQTVVHSSYEAEVGMNFHEEEGLMKEFAQVLADRLSGDEFVADGLNQEFTTGKLRKYSYVPTPDHKYIIELGLYLEDHPAFRSFNFVTISRNLAFTYSYIHDITIYTSVGKSVGKTGADGKALIVAEENKEAFNRALKEGGKHQIRREMNGKAVSLHYVPYIIQNDHYNPGPSDRRIIEIIYNEQELLDKLKQNRHVFLIQLLAAIAIALIISYIIFRLVARPLYLASHDWLTGLLNRAAFERALASCMEKNKKLGRKTALLHIDLDNFKQVNDKLGHEAGDAFIIEIGKKIAASVQHPSAVIARLGGDEFVVLLRRIEGKQAAADAARDIIKAIRAPIVIKGIDVVKDYSTTVSIGIALAPEQALSSGELYNCADQALYHAKRTGKNTFCLYDKTIKMEQAN